MVKSLYDFDGAPQALIDERLYVWQQIFAEDFDSTIRKIEFASVEEVRSDSSQKGMLDRLRPLNMNGTMYGPNMTVVGFAKITLESKAETNSAIVTNTVDGKTTTKTYHSKSTYWLDYPLGLSSDGSYKIVMTRVLK